MVARHIGGVFLAAFGIATASFAQSLHWKSASALAEGRWGKIAVPTEGVYKITYEELRQAGVVDGPVPSDHLAVWGQRGGPLPILNRHYDADDLLPIPIEISDGGDGTFGPNDYFLFFADGPHRHHWNAAGRRLQMKRNYFTDTAFLFVRVDQPTLGARIASAHYSDDSVQFDVATAPAVFHHEIDEYNDIVKYTKTGQDWFGEGFDVTLQRSFPVLLYAPADSPAVVRGQVGARSPQPSRFAVYVDGALKTTVDIAAAQTTRYEADYIRVGQFEITVDPPNLPSTVTLEYQKSHPSAQGWLNYLSVHYWQRLAADPQMQRTFHLAPYASHRWVRLHVEGLSPSSRVWMIHSPFEVEALTPSNGAVVARMEGKASRLVVFETWQARKAAHIRRIANQNLHALPAADMLIITHPDVRGTAEAVRDFHQQTDTLGIHVVDVHQIFNEFSGGRIDPMGIRMFIKMFYDRYPQQPPRYVLLVGDASFDYKNRLPGNTSMVPTYQSKTCYSPINSYATDDFFIYLDDSEGDFESGFPGSPDVAIGRLPVKTEAQGAAVVQKMYEYRSEKAAGDWRSRLLLVADDEDYNLHLNQSESLARLIDRTYPAYLVRKVYLDAFKQVSTPAGPRYPEAKATMNREIERGVLLFNYYGHGGETGLAHERILQIPDIRRWKNRYRYPVIITATCEFGRYDNSELESAGEEALFHPTGGAIALLTTTRLVFADGNQRTVEALFRSGLLGGKRLGDAYLATKQSVGGINAYKFVLLGDPALPFAAPRHRVVITALNGHPVDSVPDTLQALGTYQLEGRIETVNGDPIPHFNGKVFVTVLEKPTLITTLGNDEQSSPTSFAVLDNYIFKGTASVVNGRFTIRFVVPKDISYNYSTGSILLYAYDTVSLEDALGRRGGIVIGGTSSSPVIDTTPPRVRLYLNDRNFRDSGLTHPDPILIVDITDDYGINTVSHSIGHELVATLDGVQSIVLNDYYESLPDSPGRGVVRYPYYGLSPGWHTVTVEVWDVANNPGRATLHFYVADGQEFTADRPVAFPNPFAEAVSFTFEHNRPQVPMDVTVSIRTPYGREVWRKQYTVIPEGSRIAPGTITWPGVIGNGRPAPPGVYIYSLTLQVGNGEMRSFHGKVVKAR